MENVYYLGHPGDEVIKGKQLDKLMLAPDGVIITWENFLFYSSAFLYKVVLFFNPSVPLLTFLFICLCYSRRFSLRCFSEVFPLATAGTWGRFLPLPLGGACSELHPPQLRWVV